LGHFRLGLGGSFSLYRFPLLAGQGAGQGYQSDYNRGNNQPFRHLHNPHLDSVPFGHFIQFQILIPESAFQTPLLSQIMSRTVTLAAVRELLEHLLRMRLSVARKARRYVLVDVAMAKCARKIVMHGGIGRKHVIGLAVTGPAVMRGDLVGIGHVERHVRGMTGLAVFKDHVFGMLPVTIQATGNLAVLHMTEVAGHVRVNTGMLGRFLTLLRMTGQAGPGNVALQDQLERGVGVGMAGRTVLEFVMRTARVAHAAFGDGPGPRGRMLDMAVLTTHGGLVQAALGGYGSRLLGMAQHTLFIGKGRDLRAVLGLYPGTVKRAAKNYCKSAEQSDFPFPTQ
jgi:hypothetical protein